MTDAIKVSAGDKVNVVVSEKPWYRTSEFIVGIFSTVFQGAVSAHFIPEALQQPLWGLWAYVAGRLVSKAAAPAQVVSVEKAHGR